jgi:hypothetical protein
MTAYPRQYGTDGEQQLYKTHYDLTYYVYSHWDDVLAKKPEIEVNSMPLSLESAVVLVAAENAGVPKAFIAQIHETAFRDALARVSSEGGPYRVRYAIAQPGGGAEVKITAGNGEAPAELVGGLQSDPPVNYPDQRLLLYVYRPASFDQAAAQEAALERFKVGQLS